MNKGTKIRLKSPTGINYLDKFLNQELTVSHSSDGFVSFVEDTRYGHHASGSWAESRFEAVPVNAPAPNKATPKVKSAEPNKAARAKNGRFASRTNAPVVLRNGSLYNVARKSKGKRVLQVARLKVLTKDGKSAVLSRHGRLFFAKPEKLTLAPQSDVDAYLAEAKANS